MNWIVRYNQEEKQVQEKVYESYCNLVDNWEIFMNSTINTACELFNSENYEFPTEKIYNIDTIQNENIDIYSENKKLISDNQNELINAEHLKDYINTLISKCTDMNDDLLSKYIDTIEEENIKIKDTLFKIVDKCIPYIRNNKDMQQLATRTTLFSRQISNQFKRFRKELIDDFGNDFSTYIEIMILGELDKAIIKNKKNKPLDEPFDVIIDKNENDTINIRKIFDYKEMQSLAKKNGFIYKWSNGSHNIYEHQISKKIIVIPSHTLGIGLSIKIQKQIQSNVS